MPISIHKDLRHRGEPMVEYPGTELWAAVGGDDGVAALIQDLYRRIEQDDLLRTAFPHFNSGNATPFFMQWFGGSRDYSDNLAGGLLRRHQHRYISSKAAAAWLRCMREALVARGLDAEQVMRPLARIAKAMIHSPETDPNSLRKGCDAVQDGAQVQFEALLDDAGKGRTENVRKALASDGTLASRRGLENRTLAWVATYRNRALRYADPLVQALFSALLAFRLLPRGFSNRELRDHWAPLLGKKPQSITAGQMTYHLRRLRLHGLIERVPKSHRCRVTDAGWRTMLFCTRRTTVCYDRAWRRSCRKSPPLTRPCASASTSWTPPSSSAWKTTPWPHELDSCAMSFLD